MHRNSYTSIFFVFLSIIFVQVLSEYPEAKLTSEQQCASLGESYSDLVNKLDEGIPPLVPLFFMSTIKFHRHQLCEFNIIISVLKIIL